MSSTKTVGYFNPNRWPVIVNISAVNLNVTISPKGYVVDRSGKKINDPLLEKFVGPDMLARETSKTEVPFVLFPRPEAIVSGAHHTGIASSSEVVKDSRGIVQDSSFDGVHSRYTGVPTGVTAPSHAVATYSVEEAVKRKIFRPVIIPDDSNAPKETDGQPVRGDNLPPVMIARDASPSEARKLAEAGTIRVEAPVEVKKDQPVIQEEAAHEEAEGADGPSLDVGAHLKQLQQQLDAPEAPAPVPAPTTAAPAPKSGRPDKFVCAADGRSFKKKGYLLNHVKKHFPDKEKELMAPYADEAEE
jgi:hypothetical protein